MATRIPAGSIHADVRKVIHDLQDRLEEAEKVITTLVDAVLAAKKAPAKTAAKTPSKADADE